MVGAENLQNLIKLKDNRNRLDCTEISAISQAFKSYWSQKDSLLINNAVLKTNWMVKEVKHQVILPLSRRKEVLLEICGRFSVDNFEVSKELEKRFYWV